MRKMRKYSATEQHLLALLPENGHRISTTALAKAHYGTGMAGRKSPQQTVSWTLRSLAQKVKENKENFTVCSTKHAGPYEMEHWIERKAST